ncbi:colanic acid biosynthesis glycosyltransferase WcaI [Mucilaginibacter terrenus]|uniref:Colanic acid biosynthesis glycosyltransferase WcaI n=1 Tax=Mucilaginibacter terrenus TaxID=2482727 RepID=A0A3E2NXM4_9SPHI|nr:WcaI family glycosyltransferase [Mucilaginibacter terrenus]RFZ85776.1 colanic acid biosynthesis glycosyltransferase WcaI [Mucilaginibacter terrenus]
MDKKRILLISHNFAPEPIGIGKYNGEMINWLVGKGHDCTVITTFPYYPYWKVQEPYTNRWYKKETFYNEKSGGSLTIYRCPSYIPSDPTGKQRALQDFSFWVAKFFIVFKIIFTKARFDLIVTIAPPFHLAYLGLMLRSVTGGKLLYHIQDMQIEAARDLKLFSKKRILAGLFKVEYNILKRADFVSSISTGMIKKIRAKVDREIIFFPNWVDTDYFFPLDNRDKLKVKWGYKADDIIYLYSGAVGVKQRLERILVAAQELIDHDHVKFIICSSGPYKDQLQEQASRMGLRNISFLQVQKKEIFNEFLNMADIHLVLQISDAGDLVMPSKLTTILAVGGASIVTASEGTSLHEMVTAYDFGYVVKSQDKDMQDILVKQILDIKLDGELQRKRENARKYALEYLNVDNVMGKFVDNFL